MHLAFLILIRSDLSSVFGDAADEPFLIPQLFVAYLFYPFRHLRIGSYILFSSQEGGKIYKITQRPVMEEGYQRAFAAAQVQAVVPVRTEPLADAGRAYLLRTEIQDFFHMLINGSFPAVRIGEDFVRKIKFSGLPDIFNKGGHQPEGIVRAGVSEAMHIVILIRRGDDCGGFEGLDLVVRNKPLRLEKVQSITF